MHGRKILAAVFTAALLLTSACGGGNDSPSGSTGQSAAPNASGDLLIWTGGGAGGEATKELAAKFGEENGVNVTVQIVPKDLQTQFVTASQAGKAPDVVMGAHDWIGNLVQNGTIDPIQMSDQVKSRLRGARHQGRDVQRPDLRHPV